LTLTDEELQGISKELRKDNGETTLLEDLKNNPFLYLNSIISQNATTLEDEIRAILNLYRNRNGELDKNALNINIEDLSEANQVLPLDGANFEKSSVLSNNTEGYTIRGIPKFLSRGTSPVEKIITNTGKDELSESGTQTLFLNVLPYVSADYIQRIQTFLSGSIDINASDLVGAAFGVAKDVSIITSIIKTHTPEELIKLITYNFFLLMTDRSITSIKDPHRKILGFSRVFDGKPYLKNEDFVSNLRTTPLSEDVNLELEELRTNLRERVAALDASRAAAQSTLGGAEDNTRSTFGFVDFSTAEAGEQTNILNTFYSTDGYNIKFHKDSFKERGTTKGITERELRAELENKFGDLIENNKLGYIHIKPKDNSIEREIYGQYKIPFQFNPKINENSAEAKYATATILNRVGDLYSYTGTSQFSFSLDTSYYVLSNSDNEDINYDLHGGNKDLIDQSTLSLIQKIEYMWRSLVLPYQVADRSLFIPPPVVRIILGGQQGGNPSSSEDTPEDNPNESYSNFFTFPNKDGDKRYLRKFICTSVQINKNIEESPFVYKNGYIEDVLGFDVSASFVEVDPSYTDQLSLPDFGNYKKILDESSLRI